MKPASALAGMSPVMQEVFRLIATGLDAIRAFGAQTWGHGREPVAGFPFTGPTPEEPTIN